VLPGGAYTRGFIRTYAAYLGLDGERLAEDYRRATAPVGGERVPRRIEPVPASARRGGGPRLSGGVLAGLVAAILVAIAVGVGLAGGGGGSSPSPQGKPAKGQAKESGAKPAAKPGIALRLAATGEVWVCVLDGAERPVVNGEILEAGSRAGPFRSKRFTMAFGNGAVSVSIDGERKATPSSNSPVGYAIGTDGKLRPLEEGERPTCT
jgi:Helix-turn-helix domain